MWNRNVLHTNEAVFTVTQRGNPSTRELELQLYVHGIQTKRQRSQHKDCDGGKDNAQSFKNAFPGVLLDSHLWRRDQSGPDTLDQFFVNTKLCWKVKCCFTQAEFSQRHLPLYCTGHSISCFACSRHAALTKSFCVVHLSRGIWTCGLVLLITFVINGSRDYCKKLYTHAQQKYLCHCTVTLIFTES